MVAVKVHSQKMFHGHNSLRHRRNVASVCVSLLLFVGLTGCVPAKEGAVDGYPVASDTNQNSGASDTPATGADDNGVRDGAADTEDMNGANGVDGADEVDGTGGIDSVPGDLPHCTDPGIKNPTTIPVTLLDLQIP